MRDCSVVRSPPRASSDGERGAERSGSDHRRSPGSGRRQRSSARGARSRARSRLGLDHLMSEPSDPHTSAAGWRNWAGDQRCTPRAIERPAIDRGGRGGSRASPRGGLEGARGRRRTLIQRHRLQRRGDAETRATRGRDRRRSLLGARARAGGHHDPRAQLSPARTWSGTGEPRRHRRSEHRRRDLHGDARDGRPTAKHLRAGDRADARARRRLHARVLARARARGLPGGPRRAGRPGGDRRGDLAMRARVHAARRRRSRAAGGHARAL